MYDARIQLYKKVEKREVTLTGVRTTIASEPAGMRRGLVQITVNEAKLATLLGSRALRSKSRKATLAGGAIVAKIINEIEEGA